MSETVKKSNQTSPESYSPRKTIILDLANQSEFVSDVAVNPYSGGEPPRTSNRIHDYRRIQNWENYFLDSAIYSVAKSLGIEYEDKIQFFAAITGDMFAYLYCKKKPCDSGITNYFFVPQVVKKAYAAMGYDCIYLSKAQIKKDFRTAMNAIKASIDKGIPVLAWGMGNVLMGDGSRYAPLPEGSLIGGYDEGDILYVNLYPGPERLPAGSVDEDGYSAITNGLDTTNVIFILGEKTDKPELKKIYSDAINNIPVFLTLAPANDYVFGKQAFDLWAETLLDDSNFNDKTDNELGGICWDLHCSPYCCVCTGNSNGYIKKVTEQFPEIEIAHKILPLYEQLIKYKNEIWALHGDFFPPMEKFRTHEFRAQIAAILRQMGDTCDNIVAAFNKI
ncbi:MAG: hypothetical protein K0S55_537 [Clostridia bacterium]|nr:hypothetical protein [Clostridia bacterium]